MKKTKMQKGITLIALIITIVVLLILAIVSIQLVINGGIVEHAEDAVEKYEIEQEKEKVALAVSEAYMSGLGTITEENLESALDKNIGVGKYSIDSSNSEYFKVTITESGREYRVYLNGKVEGPFGGSSEVLGIATVGIKVETNSTIDGKAYSSTNPIIPAGFTAINVTGASWDAEGGPEVDNGLVIRDDSGNEFVWVPVTEDISTTEYVSGTHYKEPVTLGSIETDIYGNYTYSYDAVEANLERANCEDVDIDGTLELSDFEAELKNNYKAMAESVNKYDGFYVGRFETSMNGTNPQSKRSSSVSGSGETIISATAAGDSANTWYGLYALNKRYKTSSVTGSMMWGIQYDKMMSWMGDAANTTISGYNTKRTCGTAPDDVINNVYDLYGNSDEWTLEAYDTQCRAFRGGNYNFGGSPSNRSYVNLATSYSRFGSRLALFIV